MTFSPAALFLLLLPVLAASNSLVTLVTGVSIYKVFVSAAFALVLFSHTNVRWTTSKTLLAYFSAVAIFLILSSVSILWAPDKLLSLAKINNILVALVVAYILYTLRAFEDSRFQHLVTGWIIAVVATSSLAFLELAMGRNFFGSERFADVETYGHIVMSTFHNPNNFSIFLALTMPFALLGTLTARPRTRIAFACLWLVSLTLLVLSSSRVALVLAVVQLIGLIFLLKGKPIFKIAAVALGIVFIGAVFSFGTNVSSKMASLATGEDVSGITRVTLVLNGIWMFQESNWLGVGAGNFPYYIENMNPPYRFRALAQPHNFWIEVLAEYGIVVFVAFVAFFAYTLRLAMDLRKRSKVHRDPHLHVETVVLILLLLSYPIAVLSPSHYVTDPINWLFLATTVLMAKKLRDTTPFIVTQAPPPCR